LTRFVTHLKQENYVELATNKNKKETVHGYFGHLVRHVVVSAMDTFQLILLFDSISELLDVMQLIIVYNFSRLDYHNLKAHF
jgi:hypothetical protein